MNNKIRQIFLMLGLVIAMMAAVQAQTPTQLKAHIPFDFKVGKSKSLPAGDYVIAMTNHATGQQALTLRDAKSGESTIVAMISKMTDPQKEVSQLIFKRFDDRYFLTEMISPTLSGEFLKSKNEAMLSKKQTVKPEIVSVLFHK